MGENKGYVKSGATVEKNVEETGIKDKVKSRKQDPDMLISTFLTQKGITEKYVVAHLMFQYRGIIKKRSEWLEELKKKIKVD